MRYGRKTGRVRKLLASSTLHSDFILESNCIYIRRYRIEKTLEESRKTKGKKRKKNTPSNPQTNKDYPLPNRPYSAIILVTVTRHRIQHCICALYGRMHAVFSLQTVVKTATWITVKIRCVNGPYLTVYGSIHAFFDQGRHRFPPFFIVL
jgi:hypothetical protein